MPAPKIGRLAVRLVAVAIGAGAIVGATAVVFADDEAPLKPAPVEEKVGVRLPDATLLDTGWD
jgi:hypothetical protein